MTLYSFVSVATLKAFGVRVWLKSHPALRAPLRRGITSSVRASPSGASLNCQTQGYKKPGAVAPG